MSCRISVVLPVFNKENDLDFCLKSILSYKDIDMEVIAVDDKSTDKSLEVLRDFQEKDKRLKIVSLNENKGTYVAREQGIRSAVGEYIFCVDPDDYINSECFNKAKPYFGKIDIIAFNTILVRAKGNERWGNFYNEFLMGRDIADAYLSISIENWGLSPKFIKRELLLQALDNLNVSEKLTITEDLLLLLSTCFVAKTYYRIDFDAYYYHYICDESSATRGTFTFEKIINNLSQTKYVLKKLQEMMIKYDYDVIKLEKAKLNLSMFYTRVTNNFLMFSTEEQFLIMESMVECFGGCIAKNNLQAMYHNASMAMPYLRLEKLINKFFPFKTYRRKIVKSFYLFLYKIYSWYRRA